MKHPFNLYFLLALFTLVPLCKSAWIFYQQFKGVIPSYIYPIYANAGDVLRGHLSWAGSEDLDIYFYLDGMDVLSESIYTRR